MNTAAPGAWSSGRAPAPCSTPRPGRAVFRAAGELQVLDRLVVDREEAHRRAVLGRHVRDGGAVGQGERGEPRPEELDELPDDALLPEDLGDRQDEVGRGRARRELAGELEADDLGDSIDEGWPSRAASASMPPTPQPRTPRPLIIVVCESVPTRVSG